jgi:hypothetical protein
MEMAKFELQASLRNANTRPVLLEVVKTAGSDQQLMIHRLCTVAAPGLVPQFVERIRGHAEQTRSAASAAKPGIFR